MLCAECRVQYDMCRVLDCGSMLCAEYRVQSAGGRMQSAVCIV